MFRRYAASALVVLGLAMTVPLAVPAPAEARSIECGTKYTLRRGDTLSRISRRVYGTLDGFRTIYRANAAVIGRNPSIVEPGTVLTIPCADGTTPSSAGVEPAGSPVASIADLPTSDEDIIRVLASSDWAPFLNADQERGGMLTEIMGTALAVAAADGVAAYEIDFTDDRSADIRSLLSHHVYDLGLAGFRPTCEAADKRDDGSKSPCTRFEWSDALFEQVIDYYTRVDFPAPASHAALRGMKLCSPAGHSIAMLEEMNLVAPNVTLIATSGPVAAFDMLLKGDCDAVAAATDAAVGAIVKLGAARKVTVHLKLSQSAALRAVIAKTHPRAKQLLATLNSGLRQIKADTRWFSIVQRHLAAYHAEAREIAGEASTLRAAQASSASRADEVNLSSQAGSRSASAALAGSM